MTQQEALEILQAGHNVFLTGQAGSGKTHVLNAYIKYLREHDIGVGITASTGIAATHIGGMTIHAWSGIGIKDYLHPTELEGLEEKKYLWDRFQNTNVLVIDEISMLPAHILDLIDQVCRVLKRNESSFGGMQVIFCGDLFQLPPVGRRGEEIGLAPASRAWRSMELKVCYLTEQHRQNDDDYSLILNEIRSAKVGATTLRTLESRIGSEISTDLKPTKLYTHNIDVDALNEAELDKLPGEGKRYQTVSRGKDTLVAALKKSCLAPETLRLKRGAVVMFVKNNYDQGYVNGTLGKVTMFSTDGYPIVETLQGKKIVASPDPWLVEENGKVLAEISQVPLRLAWAITIHKSQGMSLDAAEIDLSKTFVTGQGYVALSRVRSLKGLKLIGLNKMALEVDPEVLIFDLELQASSEAMSNYLMALEPSDLKRIKENFIKKCGGSLEVIAGGGDKSKKSKQTTYDKTLELVGKKMSLKNMAAARSMTEETILSHLEKLREIDPKLDLEYLRPSLAKLTPIQRAFREVGDTKLAPVRSKLKNQYSWAELRLARLFLK